MSMRRAAPEPVMSDVVRRRLDDLLAEVPARRLKPEREPFAEIETEDEPDRSEDPPGRSEPASETPAQRALVRAQPPHMVAAVREFARSHGTVIGALVLIGCLWGAFNLFQARTTPVAVALPSEAVSAPPASASPSPTPRPSILVHVIGAVRKPGVVTLVEDARVADAIAAAGGLTRNADPAELNLAAPVTDGSQLVIGTKGKPRGEQRDDTNPASAPPGSTGPQVNLNTATVAQLDTLPGVGPVTAQKIIDFRTAHGRFSRIEELQEVDGIGPKTYADIAPHVRV